MHLVPPGEIALRTVICMVGVYSFAGLLLGMRYYQVEHPLNPIPLSSLLYVDPLLPRQPSSSHFVSL